MKNRILLLVVLLCVVYTNKVDAQEIEVESIMLIPNDKSAIENPCLDGNNDTCSLVKIVGDDVKGLVFSNKTQYVKCLPKEKEYWVYIPTITRRLAYWHKDYLPGQIDFVKYGYKNLKAGKTYVVKMKAHIKNNIQGRVVLKVVPQSAVVKFDNQIVEQSKNGVYEITVPPNNYDYEVVADNYHPIKGIVSIGGQETKTLQLLLKPVTCEVMIRCNNAKAHVFVDNIDYGVVGKVNMPRGPHKIRIQMEGYVDVEDELIIERDGQTFSYQMKKNQNIKNIHPTPVFIYSNSQVVYLNNKKVREWMPGNPVMIMPGQELTVTDGLNNEKTIFVGNDTMRVFLDPAILQEMVVDIPDNVNSLKNAIVMDNSQINALLKTQMAGLVPLQNTNESEASEMVRLSRYDADKMYRDALGYFDQKMYNYAVGRFKVASDNGIVSANNALGVCFINGYGVEKNIHAAKYCFEKGMNNGDLQAQCNLGHLYYENHDYGMAYSLLQDCLAKCLNKTELKNTRLDSQYMLGIMHLNRELPDDVNANSVIGIQYLKDSAREGYKPAQEFLEIYEESQRYMEKMRRQQQSSGTYSPVNNYNTNISNNSNYNGYRNMTPYRSNNFGEYSQPNRMGSRSTYPQRTNSSRNNTNTVNPQRRSSSNTSQIRQTTTTYNYGEYSQPNRMGSRSTYPQRTNSSRNNTNTVNPQRRSSSNTSQIRQTTTTYPKRRVSGSPSPRRSAQSTGMYRNGSYGGRR